MSEPINAANRAVFRDDKMAKVTLSHGEGMLVGLNCFRPGQDHAAHTHAGMDKLYHVLSGRGTFTLGDASHVLAAGEQLFVPGGASHGVTNDGETDLVVLTILAPPPAPK